MSETNPRIEHDLLGDLAVPGDAYYGVQTARALVNFHISGVELRLYPDLIKAFGRVTMAAARANADCGALDRKVLAGIERAGVWRGSADRSAIRTGIRTARAVRIPVRIAERSADPRQTPARSIPASTFRSSAPQSALARAAAIVTLPNALIRSGYRRSSTPEMWKLTSARAVCTP